MAPADRSPFLAWDWPACIGYDGVVTGAVSPDCRDCYHEDGVFQTKTSYVGADHGWYIWWDNVSIWFISAIKGTPGAAAWGRSDPSQWGPYTPQGTATGTATFAAP